MLCGHAAHLSRFISLVQRTLGRCVVAIISRCICTVALKNAISTNRIIEYRLTKWANSTWQNMIYLKRSITNLQSTLCVFNLVLPCRWLSSDLHNWEFHSIIAVTWRILYCLGCCIASTYKIVCIINTYFKNDTNCVYILFSLKHSAWVGATHRCDCISRTKWNEDIQTLAFMQQSIPGHLIIHIFWKTCEIKHEIINEFHSVRPRECSVYFVPKTKL